MKRRWFEGERSDFMKTCEMHFFMKCNNFDFDDNIQFHFLGLSLMIIYDIVILLYSCNVCKYTTRKSEEVNENNFDNFLSK